MAITKAVLLTRVNQVARRSETDIDEVLKEALIELSRDTLALRTSTTGTLSSSTNTISKPSDLIGVELFYLDSGVLDPLSFDEWKEDRQEGYCFRGNAIYISPTPNSDKSYTLYYYKQHAADPDTIEFTDEYKMALVHKVAQKIYENYELDTEAAEQRLKYQIEVADLTPAITIGSEIRKFLNLRV